MKNPGNQSKAWEGLPRGGEMGRGHVTTSLNGDASGCTQLCSGKKEMSRTSTNFQNYGAGYKILIFSSTSEIFQGLQATICQVRQLDCIRPPQSGCWDSCSSICRHTCAAAVLSCTSAILSQVLGVELTCLCVCVTSPTFSSHQYLKMVHSRWHLSLSVLSSDLTIDSWASLF